MRAANEAAIELFSPVRLLDIVSGNEWWRRLTVEFISILVDCARVAGAHFARTEAVFGNLKQCAPLIRSRREGRPSNLTGGLAFIRSLKQVLLGF